MVKKVKKVVVKNDEVLLEITVGSKKLSMSINARLDYVLIHHTTEFSDFTFPSFWENDVKVKELNEDGSIYSVGFNAKI